MGSTSHHREATPRRQGLSGSRAPDGTNQRWRDATYRASHRARRASFDGTAVRRSTSQLTATPIHGISALAVGSAARREISIGMPRPSTAGRHCWLHVNVEACQDAPRCLCHWRGSALHRRTWLRTLRPVVGNGGRRLEGRRGPPGDERSDS